ncbi:hypothetical protein JI664_21610 [Rhodobacter sp. NTK016B]|uniref:hypothetical protein n=1 Tax=Rhodobacter sp. NTK016B TaxID=2759676 RepID=UPI001A8DFAE2|nr:hypothetical protein [Rhodobacter sp. NTK016B]MBN8294585.1 hypothetical protein [Rhodobacter sp. NTK016B]
MLDTKDLTEALFAERFIAHCLKQCGFTHFDDGSPVADYAAETAKSYFSDPLYREEGPEACADSDMDYWGEG